MRERWCASSKLSWLWRPRCDHCHPPNPHRAFVFLASLLFLAEGLDFSSTGRGFLAHGSGNGRSQGGAVRCAAASRCFCLLPAGSCSPRLPPGLALRHAVFYLLWCRPRGCYHDVLSVFNHEPTTLLAKLPPWRCGVATGGGVACCPFCTQGGGCLYVQYVWSSVFSLLFWRSLCPLLVAACDVLSVGVVSGEEGVQVPLLVK